MIAAELAGANDFINHLDEGYDTFLGKWIQNGIELSIGEWQKVALARAFFRESQLIILDEPTSSLDPRAKEEFFQNLSNLPQGRLL